MKSSFLFLFFLFPCWFLSAQDTLKEQNSVMYSKFYVINEDNTFELYFHHCTGLTYGRGNIKRGLKRWKFEYDSLEIQAPFSKCTSSFEDDSICFVIRSIVDNNEFKPFLIVINKKGYGFETKIKISKDEIVTDSIQVQYEGDIFLISNDWQNCAEITLYLNDNYKTYISGGTDILKKKKNSFYLKKFVRIIDEEEFWKKGKRKKIIYQYELN